MKGETRTIILASDGRHVTVGRESEPTQGELDRAAASLAEMGLGGWLVRMDGGYYGRGLVRLTCLRDLSAAGVSFEASVAAFMAIRGNA